MANEQNDNSKKLDVLGTKIDRLIEVVATKNEVQVVQERFANVEHTVQHIATATDGMVQTYETLYVEYAVIKVYHSRYERWFEKLSKKTGVKLTCRAFVHPRQNKLLRNDRSVTTRFLNLLWLLISQ